MKNIFILPVIACLAVPGVALAQTTTQSSTSTTSALPPSPMVPPAPVAPPAPGVLSTTKTERSVSGNGDSYESTKTTYGNANGAASQSSSVSVTPPPPVTSTTTEKTSTMSTSN